MNKREFSDLDDLRLLYRGNRILSDLFKGGVHSIRQITANESEAKGFYRFLQNDRVSEEDIINNLVSNCQSACKGRFVVCIQDTTEINLSDHCGRIRRDGDIGTTNGKGTTGLGFFIHPSLVVDGLTGVPYGYSDIKIWNRTLEFKSKFDRNYNKLPIEQKESYRWIEVCENTKSMLSDIVEGIVIVQDREGDIYDQFAKVPDGCTDLLIRARTNRRLKDGNKLFECLLDTPAQGSYDVAIDAKGGRKARKAKVEVRFKEVGINKTEGSCKNSASSLQLYFIEAREVDYNGKDKICWRLLTTIPVTNINMAMMCIEWYSWRWMVEEIFKILKKEGYDIEASELEYASSVRKMSLMIMEVIIKLFLMRLSYSEPEIDLSADSCFTQIEQEFLEDHILQLEGKTEKQKNPFKDKSLKRYTWAIARSGGWKGYESKRSPGITTLWIGLKYFKAAFQGWQMHRNMSTR